MNIKKVSLALSALGGSWFVYYLLFSTSYFPPWTINVMGTSYSGWLVVLGAVEMGSGFVAVMRLGALGDEKDISERILMSLVVGGLLGAFGFGVSLLVLSWPVGSVSIPPVKFAQSSDIEGIINEEPMNQEMTPEPVSQGTTKKEPDDSPYR